MRLFASILLGWSVLAATASASAQPMLSDAEAEFEAYARANCSDGVPEWYEYGQPETWSGWSMFGDEPWQSGWPLNEAEKKAGAYSFVGGLFFGRFISFTGLLECYSTGVAREKCEDPEDLRAESIAGLDLARCLQPSPEEIAEIRDEEWRNNLADAVSGTNCVSAFEAAEQLLELSVERDDLKEAVNEILESTYGACEEDT